jgi:hypothetical protein
MNAKLCTRKERKTRKGEVHGKNKTNISTIRINDVNDIFQLEDKGRWKNEKKKKKKKPGHLHKVNLKVCLRS